MGAESSSFLCRAECRAPCNIAPSVTIFETRVSPGEAGTRTQEAEQSPAPEHDDELLFKVEEQEDDDDDDDSESDGDDPPEECAGDHRWDAGDDLNPAAIIAGAGAGASPSPQQQARDEWESGEADEDHGPEDADLMRDDGEMQEGEEILEDGSSYRGQYCKGERHGWGKFMWATGGGYEGQFCSNDMHGEGTYHWRDGSTYTGLWQWNTMGPEGVMQWTDGRRYKGQFKNGLKHGEGQLLWPDGRSYTGQWEAGKQHGLGATVTASKVPRLSRWEHGKMVQWLEEPPACASSPQASPQAPSAVPAR